MKTPIKIVDGDIAAQQGIDAIVNSAHGDLLGGEGVDGAIHRAAGPELLAECRRIGGCAEGEAKITSGYNLLARYAVHTVCPHYSGSAAIDELNALKRCFSNSLALAYANGCRSIAFPAIGCGHCGFPADLVAGIAIRVALHFLETHADMREIRFVCHPDDGTKGIFDSVLTELRRIW